MKRILIIGSSGMVGGIVLRECLNSPDISTVTSFVRKPSGLQHPKLKEIIHSDFSDYSGLEKHFQNIDVGHFCIGVYTGQVPDTEFRKITVDFAKAYADALHQGNPNTTLCFLSGQGADLTEKSRFSFAHYKGIAETYLMEKKWGGLHIFRPAYIYPIEKRKEPNLAYSIYRKLYPLMKNVFPKSVITSEQLGQAMFKAGMVGTGKMILENEDIKAVL